MYEIDISVFSDTPRCIPLISLNAKGATFSCGPATFFDTTVIGNPRILYPWPYGYHDSNRIVFKNTNVGTRSVDYFCVGDPNSTARDRTFTIVNLNPPFSFDRSVSLSYPCWGYYGPSVRVSFEPTLSGRYVDTVYLVDPFSNDSIHLYLNGDAFEAGVADEVVPQLKLFPNPCDRSLTLELPNEEPATLEICSPLGVKVYSSHVGGGRLTVDCYGVPEGIYVASVSRGKSRFTRMFVVRH